MTTEPTPVPIDLNAFEWRGRLSATSGRDCDELWHNLYEYFRTIDEGGEKDAVRFLLHVTGQDLVRWDEKRTPLRGRFPGTDVPELREDGVSAMECLLQEPALHADMRARVLDVRFLRKIGQAHEWRTAPAAYVASAKALLGSNKLNGATSRLARAVQLGDTMKVDIATEVAGIVDSILAAVADIVPSPEHLELLRFRCSFEGADLGGAASRAERWAQCASRANESLPFVRRLWFTAAQAFAKVKRADDERRCRLAAAETYVREADEGRQREIQPLMTEAHFLGQAIQAFRKIPNTKERCDELHRRMLDVQKLVPSELGSIELPRCDLAEQMLEASAAVSALPFRDALIKLAVFSLVPSRETTRRAALEGREDSIARFFPMTAMDDEGRVVKKVEGSFDATDDSAEALARTMHEDAGFHRMVAACGSIEPARRRIVAEHAATLAEVLTIVGNSPFVPADHAMSVAVGLHAGLHGDLITAGHVLAPQMEHAVRSIVRARGGNPSTLDDYGIQKWKTLEPLFDMPEAKDAFGDDLLFVMQSLMTGSGANLRNLVAHGLLTDSNFGTVDTLYLWWLYLRLCLFPFAMAVDAKDEDESGVTKEA